MGKKYCGFVLLFGVLMKKKIVLNFNSKMRYSCTFLCSLAFFVSESYHLGPFSVVVVVAFVFCCVISCSCASMTTFISFMVV